MCGIAGIFSLKGDIPIDVSLLQIITDRVAHRGPYDEGFLLPQLGTDKVLAFCGKDSPEAVQQKIPRLNPSLKSRIGFGFRRLPTLDLQESGHQPMYDPELKLMIVFNGEIYNHFELRAELQGLGYVFFSSSDTEVLLKAYHAWGDGFLHRLNGMWAFAIWDPTNDRLFCARDRYGIKPFYYAKAAGMLYFGSEMKQLLACPIDKSHNNAMIWRSMKINAMMVYGEETYWQAIHALMPGHTMVVQNGDIIIKEYYSLDIQSFESSQLTFLEAQEKYRELFLDSLKLQTRSDVEVAASLSGGMDSSAIVCNASTYLPYKMRTFSTYYAEDPALDERSWIELIAAYTGCQANFIAPTADDAIAWWDKATYLNDLPLASGFVSQFALMKTVHENGIRVLLSGQGSDEISGGYFHASYRYYADLLRSLRLKKFGREIPAMLSTNILQSLARIGKIGLSTAMPESALYRLEFQHYRFDPFNKDFRQNAALNHGILDRISDIPASRLTNFLYNMMRNTSIQTLLHFEDRMSMGNSVESRVPFLDHRLVELVFTLPSEYKIKPPMQKVIHREAMKDIVPREIYERRDKGIFSSPFYRKWMRDELTGYIRDIIYSKEFRQRGIWQLDLIHEKWQGFQKGKMADAEMLFNVIALETWARVL